MVLRHNEENNSNCKLEVSKVETHTVGKEAALWSYLCPAVVNAVALFHPSFLFRVAVSENWCHSCNYGSEYTIISHSCLYVSCLLSVFISCFSHYLLFFFFTSLPFFRSPISLLCPFFPLFHPFFPCLYFPLPILFSFVVFLIFQGDKTNHFQLTQFWQFLTTIAIFKWLTPYNKALLQEGTPACQPILLKPRKKHKSPPPPLYPRPVVFPKT